MSSKRLGARARFALLLGLASFCAMPHLFAQTTTWHVQVTYIDPTGPPTMHDISSTGSSDPATTNIILGDSVEFDWDLGGSGTSNDTHSVSHTTGLGGFDSGFHTTNSTDPTPTGGSWTATNSYTLSPSDLSSAGTYNYQCNFHGPPMTGTINVASFGTANHFVVSPSTGTPTAGTQFTVTVTAKDRNGNTVTNYNTALSFSSSDGTATFSLNTDWSNGQLIENVTLTKSGSKSVTASNGSGSGSTNVTVQAAALDHFGVTAPATATQGATVSVSVTAFDSFNNIKTNYAGTIHFTSSDSGATLPGDSTLPGGSGGFGVIFNTIGTQSISVNDTVSTGITGTANLTVNSASCPASDKTFSNTAPVTVNSTQSTSPYPSTIAVSGFASNQKVGKIALTLNGLDTNCQADPAFLLVGPGGQNFVLESLIGNCDGISRTVTLTLDDAASSNLQQYICSGSVCGNGPAQTSGTFRPSSYANADPQCPTCNNPLTFVAPAPTSGFNAPTTDGNAALASVFDGTSPNGTWSLYGLSQYSAANSSLDGGWSITITPGYSSSNPATINIPDVMPASPDYPSKINVSGVPGNIQNMELSLNGYSHTFPTDVSMLLVGPQGQLMQIYSRSGGTNDSSNTKILLGDDAAQPLPGIVSTPLLSGFYQPGSTLVRTMYLPAPQSGYSEPPTAGSATFASVFRGSDPNGEWDLYVGDFVGGDSGQIANGWSLVFELQCATCNALVAASTGTSSSFNQSVTFTATISSSFEIPGGTVTFCDGSASGGTCTGTTLGTGVLDGTGHTTFTTSGLAVGAHSITANFPGDSTYPAATSAPLSFTVVKGPTASFVGSSLNPSTFGQSVTLTANVVATPFGGSPTGTVTFKDGATTLGTTPLSAGTATLSTSALTAAASPHSITVVYSGDGNFATSTSSTLTQTVNKANSATALASSLNPSTYGTSVTFTATVTSTAGTPTGTVTFKDGTTVLGSPTLSAGKATFSSSALAVGSHSITATYNGAGDYNTSSSSTVTQTVNKQSTATAALTSKPAGAFYGQSITFTASVTPTVAGPSAPTGTVTFKDNGVALAPAVALSSGTASLACAPGNACAALNVGSHPITAVYSGDGNYTASTSSALTQTVNKTATTSAIGSSVNPSSFGQSVTLTATITSAVNGVFPNGNVTLCDGAVTSGACTGTTLGTPTLNGSGVATLAIANLQTGSHTINALYGGSSNFNASDSTSAPLTQVVNKAATTTTLTVQETPAYLTATQDLFRHQITLTATVSAIAPGAGTPGCSVTFMDNGVALGPAKSLAAGKATLTLPLGLGKIGLHPLTVAYSGCVNFAASNSSVLQEYQSPKAH